MPAAPDDCLYYWCRSCDFCFCNLLDDADHAAIYDDAYWAEQDPDWHGRVNQTLRLLLLANYLRRDVPYELEVLDFGCGTNAFVEVCRNSLQLLAWGTDIISPRLAPEYFLPLAAITDGRFDVVLACEVIEHLSDPLSTFRQIRRWLKPGGVFAFQTAYFDPASCGRDWWYVGPQNGHISLYSEQSLMIAFQALQGVRRICWASYPGIQAWQL